MKTKENKRYVDKLNGIVADNLFISENALRRKLKTLLPNEHIDNQVFRATLCSNHRTFSKVDAGRASNYAMSDRVYYDNQWIKNPGHPGVCIYPEDKIAWELYHGGILPIYEKEEHGHATYWGIVEAQLKNGVANGKVWDGVIDTYATRYKETFESAVAGIAKLSRFDEKYGYTSMDLQTCEAKFGHLMFDGVDRIFVGELLECPPGTGYKYIRPAVMRGSAPDSDGRYSVEFIVFNDELLPVEIENEDCFSGFLYDPSIGSVGHPEQLSRQAIECRIAGRRDGMSWLLRAIFGIRN